MTSLTDISSKIIDRKNNETIDGHSKQWWENEVLASKHDGYERGYAVGKAVFRDAVTKILDDLYKQERESSGYDEGWNDALDIAEQAIAALRVPEFKWRDLTDDEILGCLLKWRQGEYELQIASAAIAKFKEKQL